ncbi:MAG: HAD-IC family P-type ATPase [Clostridiales bacterium]|nr:HAD-IC family P-type ATPase [Clostridiales bacterium]
MRKKKDKAANASTTGNQNRYTPEADTGLTTEQVRERMEHGLVNVIDENVSKTTGQIIRSNVFTYFNIIFFVLAVILLYEGSFNNMTFLLVVFANTAIGIIQEIRSKNTLDKLKLVSTPEVTVIRDGKEEKVSSEDLVLDDVALFSAGNQICADAVVLDGEVTVDESLITGESDGIRKAAGDEILSGSIVMSGSARVRLDKIGNDSFAARLSKDAKKIKKKQKPGMMKSLNRLIMVIGFIIIPFAILMFWNQFSILGLDEKTSVENTTASIIGMIPEGLYLLTSMALAASTLRLARKKTLVHDMKCIEALARVDILCVDKTGTITEPEMKLQHIDALMGDANDATYAANGNNSNGAKSLVDIKKVNDAKDVENKLCDFAQHMRPHHETMQASQEPISTRRALRTASRRCGFSSATKYSAVDFGNGEAYVLGAPEFIMMNQVETLRSKIEEYSSQGERVLLFASFSYEQDSENDIFNQGTLTTDITPLALVTLANDVRENARDTFHYFDEQGVTVKVISGDNPLTVSIAAQKAGIQNADRFIDASRPDFEKNIKSYAEEYTVFGRVTPDQKRALIRTMKKRGRTVAMTGDGVNDVLALKDADCSIAMASGSDAAANVSDLVLLDSNFSAMPHVVAEGRRVINNIERSATLYLVKNIFSFILSLISIISVSLYPLKPVQLSLTSGVLIGVPSFFLAMEPNHDIVKGKFLRNVLFRSLPAALTAVVLVEWSLLFATAFGIDSDMLSTVAFLLYSFAAYLILYRVCKPMNAWHAILFILMGVLFILAIVFLPGWFAISTLDLGSALVLVTLLLLAVPIDHTFQNLFLSAEKLKSRIVGKFKRTGAEQLE